ncbi:hypothetical protein CCR75_000896 [Bremia lactucae]|uniref:Uncharacterized protein n=1 Tax=Bremia lactucae TaxID=4779 RepID=A0A976IFY3_BRELC|nr:hypothetical protein CCR75_000896 [Bremia lactucae]
MEKFNLTTLNDGKNPFVVSSNQLLKGSKEPQQCIAEKVFSTVPLRVKKITDELQEKPLLAKL